MVILMSISYYYMETRNNHSFFIDNKLLILPEVKLKKDVFLKDRPIGFIHIPKTGDSSIEYLMWA